MCHNAKEQQPCELHLTSPGRQIWLLGVNQFASLGREKCEWCMLMVFLALWEECRKKMRLIKSNPHNLKNSLRNADYFDRGQNMGARARLHWDGFQLKVVLHRKIINTAQRADTFWGNLLLRQRVASCWRHIKKLQRVAAKNFFVKSFPCAVTR